MPRIFDLKNSLQPRFTWLITGLMLSALSTDVFGSCASPTFQVVDNFGLQAPLNYTAVGDFNGDRWTDVAVTHAGRISILFGDGTGRFVTATTIAVPEGIGAAISGFPAPGMLAAGDFNSDGKSDLSVLTAPAELSVSRSLLIFFSTGENGFTIPTRPLEGRALFPAS